MNRDKMNEGLLRELYWNETLSMPEIGLKLGCSDGKIYYWMVKFGIPHRSKSEALKGRVFSEEHRRRLSEALSGEKHPNYGKTGEKNPCYGKPRTQETRRKISEANKGENNPMYGKHHSEETRRKIGEKARKRWEDPEFREKNLRILLSRDYSGKNNPRYGKTPSEETRRKSSETQIGEKSYWYGRTRPEETRQKIAEAKKGDKNPAWLGGISFEPYSPEFNEDLKRMIRERDNYTCQIPSCAKYGDNVHHIDYNKKNSAPSNLITLCNSCHAKTDFKREKWIAYFLNLFQR